jgi:hypothetical protein
VLGVAAADLLHERVRADARRAFFALVGLSMRVR